MENHPVYKYYKNYVKINGREFLWKDISVSSGKRIVVDNINGFYRPVLQYLGPKETNISITIQYGGIYKSPEASVSSSLKNFNVGGDSVNLAKFVKEEKRTSAEGLKDSFLEQKNFIQDLFESEKSKNIRIELPDGDIINCVLSDRTKSYFSLGLNTEQLNLILLGSTRYSVSKVDKKSIYNIKTEILLSLVTELKAGGIPTSFMNKIKNSKAASWLSKTVENIKGVYKTFRKYANLTKEYISKVQNVLTKVQNVANTLVSSVQEPLKILNMLKQINTQLVDIAKTPGRIVDTIEAICRETSNYLGDTKNTFKFLCSMFDFSKSNNDKLVEYYNINKIQKDIMESEVKETSNIVFFANALTTATEINYENNEDVTETILQLDKMYDSLINNDDISDNIKDLLFDGFNQVKSYLLNEVTAIRNTKYIEIKTPKTLLNIVYDYYGSDDLYDDILLLNKNILKDTICVSGKIKVFDL